MPYSLVAFNKTVPGGNGGTSASLDSSGASLLIIAVTYYAGFTANLTTSSISDSKGNTWNQLTNKAFSQSGSRIFYAKNATVGSGHTFTVFDGLNAIYPVFNSYAFSGAHLSSPFDQENGFQNNSVTPQSPGSITPLYNDELIISCICANDRTNFAVDSGMTASVSDYGPGTNMGGGAAYKIQTTLAAINPSWSWTNGSSIAVAITIASFRIPSTPGTARSFVAG